MRNHGMLFSVCIMLLVFSFSVSGSGLQTRGMLEITAYQTILFVGGTGPGNFSSIQAALDNASNGDTIFVYRGVYDEILVIDKIITLRGENKKTVIINGDGMNHVIHVVSSKVSISGFTIQNGGPTSSGIAVGPYSNDNVISDNIVTKNQWYGLSLTYSNRNLIKKNVFSYNSDGIAFVRSSQDNVISTNVITENEFYGIFLHDQDNDGNSFYYNDFMNNGQHAHDANVNFWDNDEYGNYWDDYEKMYPYARKIVLKGVWNTPYDLPGEMNQDAYPVIKPLSYAVHFRSRVLVNIFNSGYNFCFLRKMVNY